MGGEPSPAEPARFGTEMFAELRRKSGFILGDPLIATAETGSTNDDALDAARGGAPHGAAFVSDAQTRGRGRRGHTWTSPPGENLTFSLLLRPRLPAERVSTLALVVGLAVRAAAARRVPMTIDIKWPNDVVVGTKKLAGILVESRLSGSEVEAVVIGVGINVHMRELPEPIARVATSLALLGDSAPSREALLADVLLELESRLETFIRDGLGPLLDELRAHDALEGERLTVGEVHGTGAGVDEDGALLLRDDEGKVRRVTAGTVERDVG